MCGPSCCTADELVLVPPGGTPARRRKRADNAGVAPVRYTPGSTLSGNVEPTGLDRTRQACPRASQSCRSTCPGCEQRSAPVGSMCGPSCCTADELVLVPPGVTPARRRKRADNAGVAPVRYTPGSTLSGNVEPTGLDRTRQACPRASQSCRSTCPGCEQRSAPVGSMCGPSCCTADELVLVPPGVTPARRRKRADNAGVAPVRYTPGSTLSGNVEPTGRDRTRQASPRASQSCRSTRPGCEQRSAPVGSMCGPSCCTADELVLVPPGGTPARRRKRADNAGVAQVRYTPGSTLSGNVEPTGRDRPRPDATG